MNYLNRRIKQTPPSRPQKLIEQYIRNNQRMEEILEALNHPGEYTVKQYDELSAEYRGIVWNNLSLGRSIVTEFRTIRRLKLFITRYYPKLDIKDLISLFSGGFD